jgi:CheY-like chemotaxis protein
VQAFGEAPQRVAPCDLIIADMDIGGGGTGLDCIRTIRAGTAGETGHAPIPAIILTGHRAEIAPEPRMVMLHKPASATDIRSAMTALLDPDRTQR